ncbi:unnamed protein product [Phytophthora fragariaefolia]|uniref:Unnamed protein product n=1 Tax=Phytophthora fragariaefolia TaxID=1490495 RepID=A0A9W6Y953_9STRA|nr:unnamed protein product [Phytophthora fragariaefolia]
MVSMDFVIPLPVTRRGNTALLLFQDHFTGFIIAKAMSETGALELAKAFAECVFRLFGIQGNAELQTPGKWPTRTVVKTTIQTVRAYVEDPLQADWDDIAEKMVHAINNTRDTTRRETPVYLVHGWDAQSTLKSMTSTIKKDPAKSADAAQWHREANRQREISLQLAKEYQLAEKAQRAEAHNAGLSGKEKRSLPESTQLTRERSTDNEDADSKDEPAELQRSLFRDGDQVWVKKKVEEFAYELELPDKSGYRFYPVVHVLRLKKVADLGQRPTAKLVDELSENDRFDFDEELLPEDSWELSDTSDKYEVEAILDEHEPSSAAIQREVGRLRRADLGAFV